MQRIQRWHCCRAAFTIVELLVVVAIIGILIALLIPAVHAAREAARRTSCANNLRQLAIAIDAHEQTHQVFPTGGWGPNWAGDPDQGFGSNQPGGWIYNVLPYLEENSLRQLGKGLTGSAKRDAASQLLQSPLAVFQCPSRRPLALYPYTGPKPMQNIDPPTSVAKGDYVINEDISYLKSEVTAAEKARKPGMSKLILVGEKSVAFQHYDDGQAAGDKLSMYVGDCADISRVVSGSPTSDAEAGTGFGSAHSSGCNVAMGDGAVRFVVFGDALQP